MITLLSLGQEDLNKVVNLQDLSCFDEGWSLPLHKSSFDSGNYYMIGCFDDDRLVGYASGTLSFETFDLTAILTHPSYRRRGVATALINAILDKVKGLNATEVFLEVREDNVSARSFYQGYGFKFVATRKDYYQKGVHAVVMKKELCQ